jgi:hypothetical protein
LLVSCLDLREPDIQVIRYEAEISSHRPGTDIKPRARAGCPVFESSTIVNDCLLSVTRLKGVDAMAGTAVVAMTGNSASGPGDVTSMARAAQALIHAGWRVVLATPSATVAGPLTLAVGQTRSGRRAIPVLTHLLVDPADPALAHPPSTAHPAPLAILEAEAIAALTGSGFPVVVSGWVPVVPFGDAYRDIPGPPGIDEAAAAQRLAGDLGAGVLAFVAGGDGPLVAGGPSVGEIDVAEAERRLADEPRFVAELRAAIRFLRAGGELALLTTPGLLPDGVEGRTPGGLHDRSPAGGTRLLRIRRSLDHPTPTRRMANIRDSAPIRSIDEVTSGMPWLSGSSPRR